MERRQHVIIGRNLQQKIFPKIALLRKCAVFPEKYIAMIGKFRVPLLTEKKIATYVWMGEIGEEWNQTYFSQLPSRKMVVLRPTAAHKFWGGEGDSLFLRTLSFLPKPIVMECLDCTFCIPQTGGEGVLVPEGGGERRRVFFSDRAYG